METETKIIILLICGISACLFIGFVAYYSIKKEMPAPNPAPPVPLPSKPRYSHFVKVNTEHLNDDHAKIFIQALLDEINTRFDIQSEIIETWAHSGIENKEPRLILPEKSG